MLAAYGGWEGRTRRDHRGLVLERLGWRTSAAGDRKQLDTFLLSRALEHDAPGVQLACDWVRNERIIRPPVDALSRRVATARDGARAEICHRLAGLLAPPRPATLNGLLEVDDELGMTRLAWLRRGATAATPEVLKAELAKLESLRAHGADQLDLSALPAGRRRGPGRVGAAVGSSALSSSNGSRSESAASPPAPCRATSSTRAPPPTPTSPTSTQPTAPRSSRPPGARRAGRRGRRRGRLTPARPGSGTCSPPMSWARTSCTGTSSRARPGPGSPAVS